MSEKYIYTNKRDGSTLELDRPFKPAKEFCDEMNLLKDKISMEKQMKNSQQKDNSIGLKKITIV